MHRHKDTKTHTHTWHSPTRIFACTHTLTQLGVKVGRVIFNVQRVPCLGSLGHAVELTVFLDDWNDFVYLPMFGIHEQLIMLWHTYKCAINNIPHSFISSIFFNIQNSCQSFGIHAKVRAIHLRYQAMSLIQRKNKMEMSKASAPRGILKKNNSMSTSSFRSGIWPFWRRKDHWIPVCVQPSIVYFSSRCCRYPTNLSHIHISRHVCTQLQHPSNAMGPSSTNLIVNFEQHEWTGAYSHDWTWGETIRISPHDTQI